MTIIISAVVSFVIFLGVFSYMMGVFDPPPPEDAAETQAADESGSSASTSQDYVSKYGEAAAAVEQAQQSQAIDTIAEVALLDQRRKEIEAEERKLAKERKELEALRAEVEDLMNKKQAIAEEKLSYIAKLLDAMKPDEMSGLIASLDNATIMDVLPRMKPQTASRVLASLPPERAATITMELIRSEGTLNTP
ncbi:MAG: hypothetical protein GF341_00235 [candidate division Zixibacteria bacterium]|nr:hypothetical protein [candidate division Zixibacteria bacterium]